MLYFDATTVRENTSIEYVSMSLFLRMYRWIHDNKSADGIHDNNKSADDGSKTDITKLYVLDDDQKKKSIRFSLTEIVTHVLSCAKEEDLAFSSDEYIYIY